ncbi:MAG TPA: hypothetical protein VLJ88_12605 [Propionibacteriaceae bacterium]|nr:hypothetical protein [Propionibacteriaceae bacterium]
MTRVATAAEPSAYTFRSSAPTPLVASITGFANVDPADPVDSYVGQVNGASLTLGSPAVTTREGNELAVWFGTQVYNAATCDPSLISVPAAFVTVPGGDCLSGSNEGLAFESAYRQLGAPATSSGWAGSSLLATTNIAQVVTLRPSSLVQAADRFASSSVDVGKIWDGYDAAGKRDVILPDSQLHEPSGLAASRINPDTVYVHSESDVEGMVAVDAGDARVVGSYDVAIPQQWDWEDIATGPCPSGSCLFAGDIGRSNGKPNPPSTFAVYRVPEPDLAAGEDSGVLTGDWFRFRYPDGAHNAEALMVHPDTGVIYVITKEMSGRSGVYTFPDPLPAPSPTTITTLTKVATLQVPIWTGSAADTHAATWYAQVTAAAIHPGSNRLLVRTPYRVWEYRGTDGDSFQTALEADPVALTVPADEGQGEAIDYRPDGSAYYTVSEKATSPFTLKRVDRR